MDAMWADQLNSEAKNNAGNDPVHRLNVSILFVIGIKFTFLMNNKNKYFPHLKFSTDYTTVVQTFYPHKPSL